MAEMLLAQCLTQNKSSTNASHYVNQICVLQRQWRWAVPGRRAPRLGSAARQTPGAPRWSPGGSPHPRPAQPPPRGHLPAAAASEERPGEAGSQASRVALGPRRGAPRYSLSHSSSAAAGPGGPSADSAPAAAPAPAATVAAAMTPAPAAQAAAAPAL